MRTEKDKAELRKLWLETLADKTAYGDEKETALDRLRWCIAYRASHSIADCNQKDLANICLDGMEPTPKSPIALFETAWNDTVGVFEDADGKPLEGEEEAYAEAVEVLRDMAKQATRPEGLDESLFE